MNTKLKHTKFLPFTKESFDEKFWYQIRRSISMVESSYQEKGLSAYKTLSKLLVELNTCDEINKCFAQSSIQDFFFEKLFPCAAKSILSRKTSQSKNQERLLNNCLRQMIQTWLRTLPNYSPGLFRMVQLILNPSQAYYRFATSKQNKNKVIKDSNKKAKYAIIKSRYCNSEFFVDLLNYFGEIGGFDNIFNILIDKEHPLSGVMVCGLCSIIGNINPLLTINFRSKYNPKFYQAMYSNLEKKSSLNGSEKRRPKNSKAILQGCKKFIKHMFFHTDKKTKIMDKIRETIYKTALAQVMSIDLNYRLVDRFLSQHKTQNNIYSLIDPVELNQFFSKCLGYSESQTKLLLEILKNRPVDDSIFRYFLILEKRYPRDYFKRIINKCLENWEKNIFNCLELVILKEIVLYISQEYLYSPSQFDKYPECKSYLIKQKNCHLLILNYFKNLKSNLSAKIPDLENIDCELLDSYLLNNDISYFGQITLGLKVLTKLADETWMTLDFLNNLWTLLVEDGLTFKEGMLFVEFLSENLSSNDNMRSNVFEKDDRKDQKILFLEIVFSSFHSYLWEEYATNFERFFRSFWLKVNCYKTTQYIYSFGNCNHWNKLYFFITVLPHQLQGNDLLWRFLFEEDKVENFSNNQDDITAFNTLVQIYTCFSYRLQPEIQNIRKDCLENCFYYISKNILFDKQISILEPNCVITTLKLLNRIMDVSEINGSTCFKTCSQLSRSVAFKLCIKNEAKCLDSNVLDEIIINVRSNHTVYDVLRVIGKEFRIPWDEITLYHESFYGPDILAPWSKTLLQLGITSFKTITARLNNQSTKELFPVDEKRTYNLVINRLLSRLTEEYLENGMMSPENIVAFMRLYSDNCQSADDHIINQIFSDFDKDRDGYLSFDEFQRFLLSVCNHRNLLEILRKINFRSDGRSLKEVNDGTIDFKSQFSYLINSNEQYFKLLFSLLEQENVRIAEETWIMLDRLPPCPLVFTQMVKLEGIREITDPQQRDWNKLLDLNRRYKLLYSLKIVEYLLSDAMSDIKTYDHSLTNDTDDKMLQCLKDPKLRAFIETWYVDFVKFGGFDHLCGIFMLLPGTELVTEFTKGVASFLKAIQEESIKLSNLVPLNLQEASKKSVEKFLNLAIQNKKQFQATLNMHKHLTLEEF